MFRKPFLFSSISDGEHTPGGAVYSDGVTVSGDPGSAGATVTIIVQETIPDTMYYYCENHASMGGGITINDAQIAATFKDISVGIIG